GLRPDRAARLEARGLAEAVPCGEVDRQEPRHRDAGLRLRGDFRFLTTLRVVLGVRDFDLLGLSDGSRLARVDPRETLDLFEPLDVFVDRVQEVLVLELRTDLDLLLLDDELGRALRGRRWG